MPWEQIGLTTLFKVMEVLFVVVLAAVMAGGGYLIKCATEALLANNRSEWARRLAWINKWAARACLTLVALLVLSVWTLTNWQCAGNYLEHGQLKTDGQMMESSEELP